MRDEHGGEPIHAELAQALRRPAVCRPGVDEHGIASPRIEQDGVALADVEEPHHQAGVGRILPGACPGHSGESQKRDKPKASENLARAVGAESAPPAEAPCERPGEQKERGVSGGKIPRARDPHLELRPAGSGRPRGDLRDVGREQAGERGDRLDGEPRQLPHRRREHPQPHHRRDGRKREQVRHEGGHRQPLEVMRHQRGRRQRGRDRDRRTLRQRTAEAPPPPAERPSERRRPDRDPDYRGEAELPANVARGPRIDGERGRRGQQQRIPTRGGAARERGDDARRAHDTSPLDRRTRSRHRDVERDQHEDARQSSP